MSLNETPSSERVHIGFFGVRNAGKSSLVNAIANQEVSLVSEVKGTTTDPVKKAIEILPLGPCVLIDTAGFDDEGDLGQMRIKRTLNALESVDIAVLCVDVNTKLGEYENGLIELFEKNKTPYITVYTKCDGGQVPQNTEENTVFVSSKTLFGINELKEKIASIPILLSPNRRIIGDDLNAGDTVVLVTPIDESAPKGRLILPQQQTLRDILDANAIAVVTRETELEQALSKLSCAPKIVITDSQAFETVSKIVPESVPLTSFSILMARYKGFLEVSLKGANALDKLTGGEKILISEGCTHHRQCNDIGTVKLPKWINAYTKKNFNFDFSSGNGFPEDLSDYALVIHCGGCMLNLREMHKRMKRALAQNVPFTNYGVLIAKLTNTLERTSRALSEIER